VIPIRTRKALLNVGLTEEQAEIAWDIIMDHLGIAGSKHTKKSKKSQPTHKIPLTEDENFWRKYDEYKLRDYDTSKQKEDKPKHAIEITDMINAEITKLRTEPEVEESITPNTEKRIIRKNKNGQW
jgi:hypothetical protein